MSMEFHRGRLRDHVHLRVADLAASKRFYTAVLDPDGNNIEAVCHGPARASAESVVVMPPD